VLQAVRIGCRSINRTGERFEQLPLQKGVERESSGVEQFGSDGRVGGDCLVEEMRFPSSKNDLFVILISFRPGDITGVPCRRYQ